MKYSGFKEQLNDGVFFSIYLLEGEDAYFRKHALDEIVKTFVEEKELNFMSFSGDDLDFDALLSSLEQLPFMSKKRVTAIFEFYPEKNKLERLKGFLNNPPENSVFIIVNEKISDTFKKFDNCCVVDCSKADAIVIKKWVEGTFAKNNVEYLPGAVSKIIEYCLFDMTRIECEVKKLCDYALDGAIVDEELVDYMVSKDTEYKIYELTDYIGRKKIDSALYVVKELLSKGENEQRLLVSIYNYFRRLLHVSISTKTNEELASIFGVKEFAIKKAKEQAKLFKAVSLKNAVDTISDADYRFKSGKIELDEVFWHSLFKIMI